METLATPIRKREVYDYTPKTTDEIYLLLKDILQHDTAITYEDGEKVYALIFQALTEEKKVILDFQGITLVIPAFLHAAIGELYKDFDSDFLNSHLTFINIEETNKALLDMTMELAQEYFSNLEVFERAIKNTL
jgi:hypothetical protein